MGSRRPALTARLGVQPCYLSIEPTELPPLSAIITLQ
jgi:hypothetical protein